MANTRSANTWFVDTAHSTDADDLAIKNVQVTAILVTATTAGATLVLSDPTTGAKKLDIRVATANSTQTINLADSPLMFPNGIRVATLTNCVATLVGK